MVLNNFSFHPVLMAPWCPCACFHSLLDVSGPPWPARFPSHLSHISSPHVHPQLANQNCSLFPLRALCFSFLCGVGVNHLRNALPLHPTKFFCRFCHFHVQFKCYFLFKKKKSSFIREPDAIFSPGNSYGSLLASLLWITTCCSLYLFVSLGCLPCRS